MAKNSPSSIRVASPPPTIGTDFPAWIWYGPIEWPFKLRHGFTGYVFPSRVTSNDSMHSCIAAPISFIGTSIPAIRIPTSVDSFTASSSGSNFGLNATVHAQSMIRPSI